MSSISALAIRLVVALAILGLSFSVVPASSAHISDFQIHLMEKLFGVGKRADLPSRGWLEPFRAPVFRLSDQTGRTVSSEDFRGKVVLLHFLSADCEGSCAASVRELKSIQRTFGSKFAKELVILSVSVDGGVNQIEILKKIASENRIPYQGWSVLGGSKEDVEAIARVFGAYVRVEENKTVGAGAASEYSPAFFLIDRDWKVRKRFALDLLKVQGRDDLNWLIRNGGK